MADVKTAAALLTKYKQHIQRGKYPEAKKLLTNLKLLVVQFPALPPQCQQTATSQQELLIARDMLEQSVLLAIKLKEDALFQRNFQQLQVYYTDMREALPPSEVRQTLLGLNLVRLLVAGRIADFHIELETLGPQDQSHPAISFPKQLEQALMEGTYSQVVSACKSAPSPHMTPLLTQLAETVRDELASCAAAAYSKLLLKDAAKMLGFQKQQELLAYCQAQGWQADSQHVHFTKTTLPDVGKAHLDVFKHMLTYARELDRII